MTAPKRWLEQGAPSEVARLLRAGQAEQPQRRSVQRTLIAVGVTGALSTAAGGALGAGSKAAAQGMLALVAKWTAVGVVSAGAIVGTATGVQRYRLASVSHPAASATNHAQRPPRVMTAPSAVPAQGASPIASAAQAEPDPTAARLPLPAGVHPAHSTSSLEPVDSALAEEIGLIDHARASLRSGNANATLQQVSDYDRRFVAGRFAPEALYLKMEALLKLGKNQAASVAAQGIIDRYPQGPQVGRAAEVLRQLNNSNYP